MNKNNIDLEKYYDDLKLVAWHLSETINKIKHEYEGRPKYQEVFLCKTIDYPMETVCEKKYNSSPFRITISGDSRFYVTLLGTYTVAFDLRDGSYWRVDYPKHKEITEELENES